MLAHWILAAREGISECCEGPKWGKACQRPKTMKDISGGLGLSLLVCFKCLSLVKDLVFTLEFLLNISMYQDEMQIVIQTK